MFSTVLHTLNSPQNVGMIVRTHVAMGGGPIVMIGKDRPWRFRKGTQAFSRKLERLCEIRYLTDDRAFFTWCDEEGWTPVAIEIGPQLSQIAGTVWPKRSALVFGNERIGLSSDFVRSCHLARRIPQFGEVGSLNVAIAHAMATYELQRSRGAGLMAQGTKYPEL